MTTLREEAGNAAESMNKISLTLMNRKEVTEEISSTLCRIQDDLCNLFDILPKDIKIAKVGKIVTKVIDKQDSCKKHLKDSDYVALNSDGKIVSCNHDPQIAKAEAIIKGIYSPFVIQAKLLIKDHRRP